MSNLTPTSTTHAYNQGERARMLNVPRHNNPHYDMYGMPVVTGRMLALFRAWMKGWDATHTTNVKGEST